MANPFNEAHDRFDENLTLLDGKHSADPNAQIMWNLSVGLRNLTDALKAECDSTRATLEEIKTILQRRG